MTYSEAIFSFDSLLSMSLRERKNSGAATTKRKTNTIIAEELFIEWRRKVAMLFSTAEIKEKKCSYYRLSVARL